jgi:hypothetical protein
LGDSLTCGEASATDTTVAFETILKLYFVKAGKIEFLYRKDSVKESGGWISGVFNLYVNGISKLDDNSIDDSATWKYFSYDIDGPGM